MGEPFCAIDINPDNEAQELLESLNFKQAKTSQDDTLSAGMNTAEVKDYGRIQRPLGPLQTQIAAHQAACNQCR